MLADAVREMLADNRQEKMPARGASYTSHLLIKEAEFSTEKQVTKWRSRGGALLKSVLNKSERVIWATGNHLGVLPVYDELSQGPGDTLVIQFDAHLDIFNLTDCEPALTHGNFLMHVAGKLPRIINVGSRDLMLPSSHIRQYFHHVITVADLVRQPGAAIALLQKEARKARRIVLDLDCDVFDPAFFPAVLHPTPFGLTPHFLLEVIDAITPKKIDVLAISEFAPDRDQHDISLGTLLWLLEWLLLRWHESESTSSNL